MNIKRQYSLPNCNLVLEGIENDDSESVDMLDGQSPMSILINAECNFLNSNQKLSGGSVFLDNLAQTVSNYAQGFLSGLPHPNASTPSYPQIAIEKVADRHLHRLTCEAEPSEAKTKTEVNLTTIELFDLVDAIDQFYSDRLTLPDKTLQLRSVSRRYRQPDQPLAERLTPFVVGLTSLAMAAGAFFVIPPPEMNKPKPGSVNQTTKQTTETESNTKPGPNQEPIPGNIESEPKQTDNPVNPTSKPEQ